ncbi:hypothetical protein CONCODRAFT_9017 [Conidiobolus coronatus NRRL 28638]|uniref:Uncharacterized protein n=1 Tax=Conidiobolus coronatus (strain ATCC 28846 / CBS 209.66 / NRRL 28638) TaxID=796925 RepID=A0A137P0X4_CONC2|nr:hypothetical protein CONCODRAFT_9017 [Conidiobolus coronatus NRRL 28638]|eukprot:KXN68687.1 hypothetical protein CONCODRAFT_9017 [Conidiobolus coronatus NRRL 28638]
MSTKEILILIDCSDLMNFPFVTTEQAESDNDKKSMLIQSLLAIIKLFKAKLNNHCPDSVGIVFYNTKSYKTLPDVEIEGLYNFHGIHNLDYSLICALESITRDDSVFQNSIAYGEVCTKYHDLISYSAGLFLNNQGQNHNKREIIWITNDSNPLVDTSKFEISFQKIINLEITVTLVGLGSYANNFNYETFYVENVIEPQPWNTVPANRAYLPRFFNSFNEFVYFIQHLDAIQPYVFSTEFQICKDFKIDIKCFELYRKQYELKKKTEAQRRNSEPQIDPYEETVPETNTGIQNGHNHICSLGKALLSGIYLLGFISRNNWILENVYKSYCIKPHEVGHSFNNNVLRTLSCKLLERDQIGIAYFILSKFRKPLFGTITPYSLLVDDCENIHPHCLSLALLPCREEYRELEADNLNTFFVHPLPQIAANTENITFFKNIAKNLEIASYKPDQFPNPENKNTRKPNDNQRRYFHAL